MSLHRRAAKRDASESAIVEMLEACGWRVLKVSVKDGPDLVVSRIDSGMLLERGTWRSYSTPRTVAIEVKTGKGKLRKGQQAFFDSWPGEKAVVRTVEEVKNL